MYRQLPQPKNVHDSRGYIPCAVCGRDLSEPAWLVHLVLNGEVLMTRPGNDALPKGAKDLGWHCVGEECRDRYGLADWTEPAPGA